MATRQLQVERRTGKVRQSKNNVLPLRHATRVQGFRISQTANGDCLVQRVNCCERQRNLCYEIIRSSAVCLRCRRQFSVHDRSDRARLRRASGPVRRQLLEKSAQLRRRLLRRLTRPRRHGTPAVARRPRTGLYIYCVALQPINRLMGGRSKYHRTPQDSTGQPEESNRSVSID